MLYEKDKAFRYLSNLYEFESKALTLQLHVCLRWLFPRQSQLRILGSLEEVEVPCVVLWVVDSPCILENSYGLEKKT